MTMRSISLAVCLALIAYGIVGLLGIHCLGNSSGIAYAGPQVAGQTGQPAKQRQSVGSPYPKDHSPARGGLDVRSPIGPSVKSTQVDADAEANSSENASPGGGVDDAFDSIEEQTQRRVEQARKYFLEKQYEHSIEELSAAYGLTKKPIFLFNIAQSYRRLGAKKQALEYYEKFVSLDPKNRHVGEATTAISELSAYLKQQDLMDKEKRRPVWKRGWFWAILGTAVGGAAIATGLAIGLKANDGSRDMRGPVVLTFN